MVDLSTLNPEQRRAVEHTDGPMLVVAGAGTGKTQVITRRIARLIDEGLAEPGEVLALTFTEKAAREMAERLYDLIGWRSYQTPVMTFHAFGTELLGRYATHIGRSIGGGLLNDTQKALLLSQHIGEVELSYYGPQSNIFEFLEGVVRYIGDLQNAAISAEQYAEYVQKLQQNPGDMHPQDVREQSDLSKLYSLYEGIKIKTSTFDYNDQLGLPLQILQHKSNIADRLTKQYKYVLVDEYQDTNATQDALLRAFIPADGNIFAVGDDDQAIYGFRGAEINNILSFQEHFKLEKPVVLTTNYRSHQEVLDVSYRLIQYNNPERLEAKLNVDKRLVAHKQAGADVSYQPYASQADELDSVLGALQERLAAGEDPASIAVLAATKAPLKQLAKLMRQRELPFALATDINIFEQRELLQLWYLLQWIGGVAADDAIVHVLLGPWFGWSPADIRSIQDAARADMVSLEQALRASDSEQAQKTAQQLDEWRLWAHKDAASLFGYRLFFETGVAQRLESRAKEESANSVARISRVFEDLHRFLMHMQDYETVVVDGRIAGYLERFPKPPQIEVSEPLGELGGIQLLTVHASKGLEFDTVYVVGCTQRNWVGKGAGGSGWEVPAELKAATELPPEHETRRLMYVAATRAKRYLQLSAATRDAAGRNQTITPFIDELFAGNYNKNPVTKAENSIEKSLTKLQRFYPLQQPVADRLPFETSDGWIEISVRDMELYERCHYDFYLEKVLKIQQPFGPQLAFGTALHGAIQAYYDGQLRSQTPPLAELHERLGELWSDRGYEHPEQAAAAKQSAVQALTNFYERDNHDDYKVQASELPIRLEIPEAKLRLRGRIDVIFDTADGIQLRDFKTGRKNNVERLTAAAKTSFQLRTYALAYQEMTGSAPHSVVLDYVVTNTIGEAELTARVLSNHREKLIKLAADIRARDFTPNPSKFHACPAIAFYGEGDDAALAEADMPERT